MKHITISLSFLFILLFLLTACSGLGSRESPAAETGSNLEGHSTAEPESAAPEQTRDPNAIPTEGEILTILQEGGKEIYWDAPDDFGPTGDVTVYNTEPLDDESTDLAQDEAIWNFLFPDLAFDGIELTGSGSYRFEAVIDGQDSFGYLGIGSVSIYSPERPDCLAPELLLEKLQSLIGMELRLDEKNHDTGTLYRGIVDGLPIDGVGYFQSPDNQYYCGPTLSYATSEYDTSKKYEYVGISSECKLGNPAEVIPADGMIPAEMAKKLCLAVCRQAVGSSGNPYVVVMDRAELGYYLTAERQLRPGYLITGLKYFQGLHQTETMSSQSTSFLIDAVSGELVATQ